MKEIWKNIIGYDGKYQVSNTGKIRSTNYNNTNQTKELKLKLNRYGYYEVKLSKNNKARDYMVGRLVAEHFISNLIIVLNLQSKAISKLLTNIMKTSKRKILMILITITVGTIILIAKN